MDEIEEMKATIEGLTAERDRHRQAVASITEDRDSHATNAVELGSVVRDVAEALGLEPDNPRGEIAGVAYDLRHEQCALTSERNRERERADNLHNDLATIAETLGLARGRPISEIIEAVRVVSGGNKILIHKLAESHAENDRLEKALNMAQARGREEEWMSEGRRKLVAQLERDLRHAKQGAGAAIAALGNRISALESDNRFLEAGTESAKAAPPTGEEVGK